MLRTSWTDHENHQIKHETIFTCIYTIFQKSESTFSRRWKGGKCDILSPIDIIENNKLDKTFAKPAKLYEGFYTIIWNIKIIFWYVWNKTTLDMEFHATYLQVSMCNRTLSLTVCLSLSLSLNVRMHILKRRYLNFVIFCKTSKIIRRILHDNIIIKY